MQQVQEVREDTLAAFLLLSLSEPIPNFLDLRIVRWSTPKYPIPVDDFLNSAPKGFTAAVKLLEFTVASTEKKQAIK